MDEKKVRTEEFEVSGEKLMAEVKKLLHEGNIRRITVKNESGKSLIEIPLTVGVAAAVLLPVVAAVGAIGALVAKATIAVEKVED